MLSPLGNTPHVHNTMLWPSAKKEQHTEFTNFISNISHPGR